MKNVHGRAGVVEGPVGRGDLRPEELRERAEFVVGHLVATENAAGQPSGVDHLRIRPRLVQPGARRFEETRVVRSVVRDEHAASQELQEHGNSGLFLRCCLDHPVGDAGQHGDECGDRLLGIDESAELAEQLAAAHLYSSDLRDPALRRTAACGLQVHHAECCVTQRQAIEIEVELPGGRSGGRSARCGGGYGGHVMDATDDLRQIRATPHS